MNTKHMLKTSQPLNYNDFKKFLNNLDNDHKYFWECYAFLSFATACRASDVLKLRWQDILNGHLTTIIEKKTKKTREIPFSEATMSKIKELYAKLGSPNPSEYIFKISSTNKPISLRSVNRQLKKFKERYNITIDHFSSHSFRKTFGRYVYDSNGHTEESLIILNQILKHSSIEITKRYIGISQDEINSVFKKIAI